MTAIGLDFGTGNSVLSIFSGSETRVFHLPGSAENMPSDILVNGQGDTDLDPAHLSRPSPGFRRVTALKRRLLDVSSCDLAERALLIDLAVSRLKYLYDAFVDLHPEQATKAVLTCPANAGQAYRDVLLEVGRRIGLPQVSIVDEPTAAGIHHGLGDKATYNERWLVIDWGCGTCDVSLIERTAGSSDLQVRCVRGNNALGGLDMDSRLRDHLAARYNFHPEQVPLWEVEKLKKELSDQQEAKANWILSNGRTLAVDLSRGELESVIQPLLAQAQALARSGLQEVGWSGGVEEVLATGGPMLMPAVRRALTEVTEMDEEDIHWRDPLTSVALGAARLAEIKRKGGLVVTNPVAQSIGVRLANGKGDDLYHPIIKRGETRPITGEAILSTSVDLQDVIAIELREGENPSALSNTLLGRLNVVVRPENRGAVRLKLSVRLTESSDKEIWVEPIGDPASIRQLQPVGLTIGHNTAQVEAKEQRWSDPVTEFEVATLGGQVDPDTARQEYERLKIKYHPDRDAARSEYWTARLSALDQAYSAYLAEVERRVRASTQPDYLPWGDSTALSRIPVDEVLAQRLTHCLAMQIEGPATPAHLSALLKRFPDYRRVLASYLYSLKRNPVLQKLLAEDDRPHVGLVVLLQNIPDKPIRERHEVLKAAYRLTEDQVRQMLRDPQLDVESLYRRVPLEAAPAVNPLTGAPASAAPPPRVKLQFDYRGGNTYVSGQTYDVKERLKQLGCRWDGANKQWVALGKRLTEKDVWGDA